MSRDGCPPGSRRQTTRDGTHICCKTAHTLADKPSKLTDG